MGVDDGFSRLNRKPCVGDSFGRFSMETFLLFINIVFDRLIGNIKKIIKCFYDT